MALERNLNQSQHTLGVRYMGQKLYWDRGLLFPVRFHIGFILASFWLHFGLLFWQQHQYPSGLLWHVSSFRSTERLPDVSLRGLWLVRMQRHFSDGRKPKPVLHGLFSSFQGSNCGFWFQDVAMTRHTSRCKPSEASCPRTPEPASLWAWRGRRHAPRTRMWWSGARCPGRSCDWHGACALGLGSNRKLDGRAPTGLYRKPFWVMVSIDPRRFHGWTGWKNPC